MAITPERLKDCFDLTVTSRIHGVIKTTLCYDFSGVFATYVEIANVTMHDGILVKMVGATLVFNLRHEFCAIAGATCYDAWSNTVPRQFVYRYSNIKEKQKITQHHHQHVRMVDIFKKEKTILTGFEAEYALALDRLNTVESTHATFWVYWKSLTASQHAVIIGMLRHYGRFDVTWLKKEGMWAKQMQSFPGLQLTYLFEMNVLVNRLDTDVDWEKEKINRTAPTLAQVPSELVYKHAKQLFIDARCEGKRGFAYKFPDYWAQRVILMPAGSVHSEYQHDREAIKSLPHALHGKKGFFSSIDTPTHTLWSQRTPEIHAYTSTKYEWGKVRALYGCDVTSHMHADFSMNKCEETFPSYVPTGSRANDAYVAEIAERLKTFIPFCYDYDDFNSQHSFANMKAALLAWRDVFACDLSPAQLVSLQWTIDSIDMQIVHNSQTADVYRTTGTLFSGWRLTTFMNTTLNYAYLAASGINRELVYSLHNGDDVLGSARSLGEIQRVLANAEAYNIRAQMTKMNIGTIAEFLRMDFNATQKTGKQYLTRACATFTHSRIETSEPNSLRSVFESVCTRADEMITRGANEEFVRRHEKRQANFAAALFNSDVSYDTYVSTHRIAGGGSDKGVINDYTIENVECPNTSEINMQLIQPGVRDYITFICTKYPIMRTRANNAHLTSTLRNAFNVNRLSLGLCKSSWQQLNHLKSMRHAWRGALRIGAFSKSRMTSADLFSALAASSPAHAAALQKAANPYKMISILL